MMDQIKAVNSRSLRSNTVFKRKSIPNDDDFELKSLKRNKKKAIILSSPETSLDSTDIEIKVPVVKKKNPRSSKKADTNSVSKLFPIFQSLVVKPKEAPQSKDLLQVHKDPVIAEESDGNLSMFRKTQKSKSQPVPHTINEANNENVFAFNGKREKQILCLRKKRSNSKEWTIIKKKPIVKVHPIFERAKTNKKVADSQKDGENPMLDVKSPEKRCLRPRVKKDKSLISENSIDIVKTIKKKYSKGNLKRKSFDKKSVSVNESVPPKKLHPIFLLSAAKSKLALDKPHLKVDGTVKLITRKSSRVKVRENITELSDECLIIIKSSDDETNVPSREHPVQNCSTKNSSNHDCIGSNSNSYRYKMNEFKSEMYFPTISHIKQSCKPLYSELQAVNGIALSNDTDHKNNFVSSWNGIIGLIDFKCIEYMQHSMSIDFHTCPDNLSINNQSLRVDSLLKQESTNSNERTFTQDSDLAWTDVIHFDVEKTRADSPVDTVKSWLEAWKLKCLKFSNDYDNHDYDESDSDDDYELERAIIIYGQPGTGKTSIVHSLAQSLGFSILEVNASSSRTGRHITSQLQEAFHSYGVHNTIFQESKKTQKDDSETEEDNLRKSKFKEDVSKCESKTVIRSGQSKKTMKQGILSFNVNNNAKKNAENSQSKSKNITSFFTKNTETDKILHSSANSDAIICQSESFANKTCSTNDKQRSNLFKKKVSTLILFDDVDVVFEEDDGFWCAVNTFLKTTKRPVVFTASQHLEIVQNNLNDNYTVVDFNDLNVEIDLNKGLDQLSDEAYLNRASNILKLLYANDKRRQLLHMQFWNRQKYVLSIKNKPLDKMSTNYEKSSINDNFSCQSLDDIGKILRSEKFSDIPHLFMDHHMHSSVLYSHLFNILSFADCDKWQPSWNSVNDDYLKMIVGTKSSIEKFKAVKDVDASSLPSVLETNSLVTPEQRQMSSSILPGVKCLSYVIGDFSVANVLKSQFGFGKFLWLSTNERLKQWSAGLPMCMDNVYPVLEITCLDIISTINVLSLRKCVRDLSFSFQASDSKNTDKDLQENFLPTPEDGVNSREHCMQIILSVLPLVQQLNVKPIILEYFSFLQTMCKFEAAKKNTFQRSRRFLHYFDSISLNLSPDIFN